MRKFLAVICLSGLFISGLWAVVPQGGQSQDAPDFSGYKKNQIVIKFSDELLAKINIRAAANNAMTGIAALDRISRRYAAQTLIQTHANLAPREYEGRIINPAAWFKITFSNEVDAEQAARDYRLAQGIADAQPIGLHKVEAITPNDPSYGTQWHLNQTNDHDMDAPEAWEIHPGSNSAIVALLDTGVRYFHKDLGGANASYSNPAASRGNMWINWPEKNGSSGVDDDGNGFVDDWIGYDFVDGVTGWSGEDASTPDNDPRDFNGHGSHTGGILSAINNNGYGVASAGGGWNNGAQTELGNGILVMALRVGYSGKYYIWEQGYVSMDAAADAFYYAANNGAKLASCSWGSSNTGGLGDAVDYFLSGGNRLLFKSAGNNSNESTDYLTARSDVISVAATNSSDVKASFSSYGTWVDISAPGENIYSTYHDHNDAPNDKYATLSGTSMAAPNAASVAAMIWSKHPDWTASQVRQRLFDTADNIYGISGNASYQGKLGAGRINAFNAVNDGGSTAPVAAFTADATVGVAPFTVNFTNQSSGEITDYSWNFGDGSTSTTQNPSHTYSTPGKYTVSLTVTGPGGSDTETKTDYITVYEKIAADFSGTPLSGDAPLTVTFTDLSTGDVTAWAWNFGDGGSSSVQNPSHQYAAAGTYTVTLTASNSVDSDTETKTGYITVTEAPGQPPVANFSATPTSGNAPLTVNFTDLSTNTPTGWNWDFGDGGAASVQNPSHQYTTAGVYTVILTASNAYGSDSETKTNYITVNEAPANVMHLTNVDVTKQTQNRRYRGQARIKVVDASGNAVASATVSGTWSGSATGQSQVTTGSDGWATAYSNWSKTNGVFTFCVDNVTKSGWTYNPSANIESCGSSDQAVAQQVPAGFNPAEVEREGSVQAFNSPNPFNPTTTIWYGLPNDSRVRLDIYNLMGQRVATLVDRAENKGMHSARWDAMDQFGQKVGSGVYIYQLLVDGKVAVQERILLVK